MDYVLDPELAAVAPMIPALDFSDVAGVRAVAKAAMEAGQEYVSERPLSVEDVVLPANQDAPELRLRVYAPVDREGAIPGLLYLHGGGFVTGELSSVDNQCRRTADQTGVAVVNVGYRLAPENPYPAALDDCHRALGWLAGEAGRSRGIDPARLGVLGESSGGGLAAALALVAKDRGGPALAAQFLDAPTVDDRLGTDSMRDLPGTPTWNAANSPYSWQYYLGDIARGGPDVPAYAAPARAKVEHLVGLPPAWVSAYQVDPTRDEGLDYARHLIEAGVPTELHHYAGAFHLAHFIPGTTIGERLLTARLDAIRRLLPTPAGRAPQPPRPTAP
ncbi:alpha/beta hydrolase [Amycolatopsis rhabdoformis]|uniref:Alpha/beta hydrolase n=1 Tax=Amycolatopsis rhabdoformis TaxID=1448059 RepID=A0ABZ1I5T2_9PSEU|nr:alpha/beta hydrolase [Amycolatopsis rhabdoformis]WSE29005.1 alpha/beta hydrolase [Amycolatopsis rhabdoformis]